MTRTPETPKPDVELVPVKELSSDELEALAADLYAMMNVPSTNWHLLGRNRHGTLRRYGKSQAEGQEKLAHLQSISPDTLEAFMVAVPQTGGAIEGHLPIGMATLMPGLKLYENRGPVPSWLARKVEILHEDLTESLPEVNVSGWVDLERAHDLGRTAALGVVYDKLHKLAPSSWTIEADGAGAWVHRAIQNAGYQTPTPFSQRYDEMERRGTPPFSSLYVSPEWFNTPPESEQT